jgi:hypothetical protein
MPRIDKIIGYNFNHIRVYEQMFGMGSDANAPTYMTKYVNINVYEEIVFLHFTLHSIP